jgi:hypothetical protein
VTIEGRTPTEVVQIFERINSTGARLGAVDFMRAVTWSERFDLNRELDKLQKIAAKDGFDIPDETLMRVLAIALGYSTASDSMLHMRELSAKQLGRGVDAATEVLKRTLGFFGAELGANEYDLVPYEGQFLAVAGFYNAPGQPDPATKELLARWFWTSSLNEDLQGRSEHKVARIVESMKDFRAGKEVLKGRLTLTTAVLKERRFRWGAAISSALAAMFAKNAARSLVSGDVIRPSEFLGADPSSAFISLADDRAVATAIGKDLQSAKVIANTIVTPKGERMRIREMGATEVISRLRSMPDARAILASQFISDEAADALLSGRIPEFLEARAQSILAFASRLTFPSSGPA